MHSRVTAPIGLVASDYRMARRGLRTRMVQEEQMSERDLAKELWEHRNDPDEWEERAEAIEVEPRRSSVVSFRLESEELDEVERAAASSGETLSEYIRKALRIRLHGMAKGPFLGITFAGGAKDVIVYSGLMPAYHVGHTEASFVPDKPLAGSIK